MHYIQENLISGETVAFRARLHWVVLAKPFLIAGAFAALGIALLLVPSGSRAARDSSLRFTTIAGIACLLIAAIPVIAGILRRSSAEFAVTNKRVILKAGITQVRTLEMFLNKIESVSVDQTLWGRILGYGSIVIHGTGGSAEPFHEISHPLEFRHQVQQQIGNLS
jgi:uncharacterized membrane protein YdbT with pleckstrin-like domain